MDESFKLNQADHERYYRDIEIDLLAHTRPVSHPRVVITGGQPGSGKSRLLEQSKRDFPDGNVVVINGDDLREYHPKAEEIFRLDDRRFAERTDPDSRLWTKRLFDQAIETRRNILFESTMRDPGPISETMKRLKADGYHLTAKVVATHERVSTTGIFRRYEEQKEAKGFGRFSDLSSHDAGYQGMPKTVQHIEEQGLVDKLEVCNRAGDLLYENEFKGGQWDNAPGAVHVIEQERQREPNDKERAEFQSDWRRIYDLMEQRKAPIPERELARTTYEKLERELSKLKTDRPKKGSSVLRQKIERLKESQKEPSREDDFLNP